jgi:EAL domain-containing protein (putative c-di-GMP-specific phosphodiesterase class I)
MRRWYAPPSARALVIEAIAEGVGTEGQVKFLLSAGCEYAQGYLFSKPIGAERASAMVRIKSIQHSLALVKMTAA